MPALGTSLPRLGRCFPKGHGQAAERQERAVLLPGSRGVKWRETHAPGVPARGGAASRAVGRDGGLRAAGRLGGQDLLVWPAQHQHSVCTRSSCCAQHGPLPALCCPPGAEREVQGPRGERAEPRPRSEVALTAVPSTRLCSGPAATPCPEDGCLYRVVGLELRWHQWSWSSSIFSSHTPQRRRQRQGVWTSH